MESIIHAIVGGLVGLNLGHLFWLRDLENEIARLRNKVKQLEDKNNEVS